MASGNFTGSTSNEYITPRISWSSTSNVSTNKSQLTVRFQLKKSSKSSSSTYGTGSWTMTINGTSYSFSDVITIPTNDTYQTIYSKTVTISHNDDGSKSVTIKVTGGIPDTTYTSTSLNGTAKLDTIPRSSSFSIPSSVNTGSKLTVSITPSSSTFRHKVRFEIDGTTKYTSGFIAAGTTSFSYTIPHSWLPSTTSKTMKVYLYTYTSSGTDYIARVNKNITVNVPSIIKPTISNVSKTLVSGLDGKYVQGKSKITLTATAEPGDGAKITTYIFKGVNISGSSSSYTGSSNTKTSSAIQSSGTITYTVTAKDTRGRTSDAYKVSISVYAYAAPQVTSISAKRCLQNGTLDNDGKYAKVTVKISYSTIGGANKRTVKLYNSKDSYASGTTIISSDSTSVSYTGVYGGSFDNTQKYTIRAVITDTYNTNTSIYKEVILATSTRTINIAKHGNGVAIGGMSTVTSSTAKGAFECNWDTNINAKLAVSGNITTNGDIGCTEPYSGSNFAMYCQWADSDNHDILVRSNDGLTMALGWVGNDSNTTVCDIRPKKVRIRGETTVQGFRVPEIQHGSLSITPSAANTPTSKVVVFDKAFSGTPAVMANPLTGAPGTLVTGVSAASPSETQVTIYLTRTNTTSTGIQWVAIN